MKLRNIALIVVSFLLLTGCWNKVELPQKAFIMGVAIDQSENGKIQLTLQIYKPKGRKGGEGGTSSFNVVTTGNTLFEAVRDITMNVGRTAQWSHLRTVIVGEALAKSRNVGEVLEFFSRDHEPRLTAHFIIAKGKAADYMQLKPFIENTESQQFLQMERTSYENSSKTLEVTLLQLILQFRNQSGTVMAPYLYMYKHDKTTTPVVAGVALLQKGKMVDLVSPKDLKAVLMLRNHYKAGIIQIPCSLQDEKPNQKMDSIEVLTLETKISPRIVGDSLTVYVHTKITGMIGELNCTDLKTAKDDQKFINKVEHIVKQSLLDNIELLQKKKADVLEIGDKIYTQNPRKWMKWRADWNDRFAESKFVVDVELKLISSGTSISKPFYSNN
ncbi:Ger(x)C family spore germination protein [Paenibacillus arenilitoris]|uniref:Ger(X)C family spore germination protein n=1 Tax=Paenibacillus arenilitoris TaxID=2772299 RepID=A0A927CSH2_9BACL|nr:Ger(x)C family spore germination protein [Paenibacillus arenilitoris]MBD2872934.1 Ger(x)C family spore germination protein [Paenibacillus arenilitoris]